MGFNLSCTILKRYTTIENGVAGLESLKVAKYIDELDINQATLNPEQEIIYIIDPDFIDDDEVDLDVEKSQQKNEETSDSLSTIFSKFFAFGNVFIQISYFLQHFYFYFKRK